MQSANRNLRQELSYRKQIACQLHTQYVEGIYDNPVTLNSTVTVNGTSAQIVHYFMVIELLDGEYYRDP